MIKLFLLTSCCLLSVFPFVISAVELNQILSMLDKNSILIQSEKHKVESQRYKALEIKDKRYFYPSLQTGLSRLDGKTSASARLANTLYNSGKDNNLYLKESTSLKIAEQNQLIARTDLREEIIMGYIEIIKKNETSEVYARLVELTGRAFKKIKESTKLKVTSAIDFEEAKLDFDEINFKLIENVSMINNAKSALKFDLNDPKADLENLTVPVTQKYDIDKYKEILKAILENPNNPILKKSDLMIRLTDIEKKIGLSNYNLSANISVGDQYYKNELEKDSRWRNAWVLSLNANYPILGHSSKKFFEKAFDHKKKSEEAMKQYQVYEISLNVLTRLEELDLLYKLHSKVLQNIESLKQFWKERDLLYFQTSMTSFKQFFTLIRSELEVRLNEIDIRYSILEKEMILSEYLRKHQE